MGTYEDNLKKYGLEDVEDYSISQNQEQTIPDYTNFRNILFQYSQQFNNSVINYRFNRNISYWKQAVSDFMKMYYQLREDKRLNKLTKKQRIYMKYFYNNTKEINLKVLLKLNLLVLKIMNAYGVYDIAKQEESYR